MRRRIDLLLERLRILRLFPSPEQRRLSRAADVLEQIGSPEARALLAGLARGAPSANLTVEAKAALARLTQVLEWTPDDPEVRYRCGLAHLELKQIPRAITEPV